MLYDFPALPNRAPQDIVADGESWNMPATIDDPAILEEIKGALQSLGYGAGDTSA